MKDDDNITVKAGDTVRFTYGIPPVYVDGSVVKRNGRLVVLTPDHNPSWCYLSRLREYVGGFYKV